MPAADDQELFDYDPAKADGVPRLPSTGVGQEPSRCGSSSTSRSPVSSSGSRSSRRTSRPIGFTTEINGLETTAAIEFYNKIDEWEIIIAQGGDQGVGPFRTQNYYVRAPRPSRPSTRPTSRTATIDELFIELARPSSTRPKRTEIFKQVESILNKAV